MLKLGEVVRAAGLEVREDGGGFLADMLSVEDAVTAPMAAGQTHLDGRGDGSQRALRPQESLEHSGRRLGLDLDLKPAATRRFSARMNNARSGLAR